MKATAYAEKWIKSGKTSASLAGIVSEMIKEIQNLIETRRVKKYGALAAIIKEAEQKWKAFAKMFPNEIKPDAFRLVLLEQIPDLKSLEHLIWPSQQSNKEK